jgi:hypothetical protein
MVAKLGLQYFFLKNIIDGSNDADVISFINTNQSLVEQAKYHTPLFLKAWTILLQKMGYETTVSLSKEIPLFVCNCWIAKPQWMERYIDFAMHAMSLIMTDPLLKDLCYNDSKYNAGNLCTDKLILISGKPFYTFHPFLLERLPCFFFWVNNAKRACLQQV